MAKLGIPGRSTRAVRSALSSQMILKLPISRTSDAAARMRHRVAASTELRRGVLLTPALLPREGALRFVHRFMKGVYLLQARIQLTVSSDDRHRCSACAYQPGRQASACRIAPKSSSASYGFSKYPAAPNFFAFSWKPGCLLAVRKIIGVGVGMRV
jgi:hypothetical protein